MNADARTKIIAWIAGFLEGVDHYAGRGKLSPETYDGFAARIFREIEYREIREEQK